MVVDTMLERQAVMDMKLEAPSDAARVKASSPIKQRPPPLSFDKPICASEDIAERVCKVYTHLLENEFKPGANGKTANDEYMVCDCRYEPGCEMSSQACGPDSNCMNRELFIECTAETCPAGQYCQNRRFQTRQYASIEIFETDKKGFGLRATDFIPEGTFVIEYCGEVITTAGFKKRIQEYDKQGAKHFYFMSLKANEFIDASKKGNMSRFMNHSCSPNCVLNKWIVGNRWRIGMFTLRDLEAGQELTFDYKFERYGSTAQPCYCGAPNCSGFIGGKQSGKRLSAGDDDYDIDEDDESLTVTSERRKRTGDVDGDYEELGIKAGPVDDTYRQEDVLLLVRSLFRHASKPRLVRQILSKVENTSSSLFHRRLIWSHGLVVLKYLVNIYKDKEDRIVLQILQILRMLPIQSRNSAEKIEPAITKVAEVPNVTISDTAKELLTIWSTLKREYRIPKRVPSAKPTKAAAGEVTQEGDDTGEANGRTSSKRLNEEGDDGGSPPQKRYRDNRDRVSQNGRDAEGRYRRDSQRAASSTPSVMDRYEARDRDNWTGRNGSSYDSPIEHRLHARNSWPTQDRSAQRDIVPRYAPHTTSSPNAYASPSPYPAEGLPAEGPQAPLPPGWRSAKTNDGAVYYYHDSGKTQWEDPRGVEPQKPIESTPSVSYTPSVVPGVSESTIRAIVEQANAATPVINDSATAGANETSPSSNISSSKIEKHLKVKISAYTVQQLSKYQVPEHKFKDLARSLSEVLLDKEKRRKKYTSDVQELSESTQSNIKKYIHDYCGKRNFARKAKTKNKRGRTDKGEGNGTEPMGVSDERME
ncbi:hypothetical protein BC832DRAFT_142029 [Gaertneriomyces semiglobifer]|nr:hypothetical protein BC832DRAFT_142029 [Gaertneriomyces semiglobifer]